MHFPIRARSKPGRSFQSFSHKKHSTPMVTFPDDLLHVFSGSQSTKSRVQNEVSYRRSNSKPIFSPPSSEPRVPNLEKSASNLPDHRIRPGSIRGNKVKIVKVYEDMNSSPESNFSKFIQLKKENEKLRLENKNLTIFKENFMNLEKDAKKFRKLFEEFRDKFEGFLGNLKLGLEGFLNQVKGESKMICGFVSDFNRSLLGFSKFFDNSKILASALKVQPDDLYRTARFKSPEQTQYLYEVSYSKDMYREVIALSDFDGIGPDELSFKAGDRIEIIAIDNSQYWTGKTQGRFGKFPCHLVMLD